jgi:hypothetical protein
MTKDEAISTERALDLALEALESIQRYGLDTLSGRADGPDDRAWQREGVNEMTKRATVGITAIKQARSAPYVASPRVQEPFGYVYEVYCLPECACEMEWVEIFDRYEPDAAENIRNVTPVYTTPPNVATPLAAQRPVAEPHKWVGLTQDEFRDFATTDEYGTGGLIRAIEAKLKEKNSD